VGDVKLLERLTIELEDAIDEVGELEIELNLVRAEGVDIEYYNELDRRMDYLQNDVIIPICEELTSLKSDI